jgi:NAD(P)-dependent dehydrogenase (short-subunit alcohol dehydrogenase family)
VTPSAAGSARRPVAVVTGASRGLGAVIARLLAGEGHDLVLVARDELALQAVAREATALGASVEIVVGDVSSDSVRDRIRSQAERRGGVDVLVNNAAVLGPTPLPPLLESRPEDLERVYRVNVVAPVALTAALLPWLTARGALVVNLSSDAAVGGYPGWGNYGASKAALDLASLTLAHELGSRGISVVAVDPGEMRTPGARPAFPPEEFAARPPPEATLPFWAWLFGRPRAEVNGRRFRAQSEHWGMPG